MYPHDPRLDRRDFLKVASLAVSASMASAVEPLATRPVQTTRPAGPRVSYYYNGEIHVNRLGTPEGKPLTTGHMDFKPSWSRTGNRLVFFRRTKDDPEFTNWKCAIAVINVDGTEFHQLSDGTHTDFNPTWTRDEHNTPIWNRRNEKTGGYYVMQSKIGNKPGQEVAISDESHLTWAHSSLKDGRILVASVHPRLGSGLFLLTRRGDTEPLYEPIDCELGRTGLLDRISVSPSEKRICFEYQKGFQYTFPGRTLYIADFDARDRTITNPEPIANKAGKFLWYAYPRWIDNEAAVIYHSGETGQNQLYVYQLADATTRRVSTVESADYRYPHGEAAPC